jgi:hypothetical protein
MSFDNYAADWEAARRKERAEVIVENIEKHIGDSIGIKPTCLAPFS